jgi:DNA-binding NarL/FixJ family response regulator
MFGTAKAELKLNDYISKNSGFDAQLKTKIEAIIEAAPKGEEEVKVEVSAFIDYIMKDQNYYLLLKDLKITDEAGIEEIKSFVEKAKEIAAKNKYITLKDEESAQIMSILKQLTPDNILAE